MNAFVNVLEKNDIKYKDILRRKKLTTLQVNLGVVSEKPLKSMSETIDSRD